MTAALVLAACKSTTIIDQHRISAAQIGTDDAIVVLGRRHGADHETEYDFIDCVGGALSNGQRAIKVIPEKTFVDSMYPYFETSTAPTDVKNLEKLVRIPEIAHKFNEFGVRYFVWIDGYTETTNKAGSITCSFSPAGGGCLGFATWDDEASYEASIWDFKELTLTGKISAETQGTSYLPAIIIPIPLLARVQASACKTMAEQIKSFFE
ncbi:MAG: hypothetical protein HYY36_05000 [Gammaproteobacteria bacterium]|nr:hypothetical protein [Gammaproteobacteria bacterium]